MPTSRRTVSLYHELFVEAGDNDCEARPGSRQIGHDRFVAFEIVVGHLSKAARFLNFIGRSLASTRCDTYSVPEITTDGITGV